MSSDESMHTSDEDFFEDETEDETDYESDDSVIEDKRQKLVSFEDEQNLEINS